MKLRKDPAFSPVTDGFQQKWNAILFNAEKNLVELLFVETDSVIKKLELDFNKELKRQFPDSIEGKKVNNQKETSAIQDTTDHKEEKKNGLNLKMYINIQNR